MSSCWQARCMFAGMLDTNAGSGDCSGASKTRGYRDIHLRIYRMRLAEYFSNCRSFVQTTRTVRNAKTYNAQKYSLHHHNSNQEQQQQHSRAASNQKQKQSQKRN